MTFLELAESVLTEAGRPLTAKNIIEESKKIICSDTGKSLFDMKESDGKTPEKTLRRDLHKDVSEEGNKSRFVRLEDNKVVTYSLRKKYIDTVNDALEYIEKFSLCEKLYVDGYMNMRELFVAKLKEEIEADIKKLEWEKQIKGSFEQLEFAKSNENEGKNIAALSNFKNELDNNNKENNKKAVDIYFNIFSKVFSTSTFEYLFKEICEKIIVSNAKDKNCLKKKGISIGEKYYVYDECYKIEEIKSVESFIKQIKIMNEEIKNEGKKERLFYRGHSNSNYLLKPSVFRTEASRKNEDVIFNEMIIKCPSDFAECKTTLDYLIKMQHYNLSTRMMDISENALVGLYFACKEEKEKQGEVIVLMQDSEKVKYHESDTVDILSSLARMTKVEKDELKSAISRNIEKEAFNETEEGIKLAHLIANFKPGFKENINPKDLNSPLFVSVKRSNERIIRQQGLFVLFGLEENLNPEMRTKTILIVDDKEEILKELEAIGISEEVLFPDISNVAEEIKKKYT